MKNEVSRSEFFLFLCRFGGLPGRSSPSVHNMLVPELVVPTVARVVNRTTPAIESICGGYGFPGQAQQRL